MLYNSLNLNKGNEHYRVAEKYLLSGTSSPPRMYPLIGRPLFIEKADGAYLFDSDGNRYIDFHMSSGAAMLGHNHPSIKEALLRAAEMGFFCGYEANYHARVAEHICEMVPSAERVRFCGSGSDTTAAALRISRAVTGRKRVLKFEGHFHGTHDMLLFNMDAKLGRPREDGEIEPVHESAGVPDDIDRLVTVLPFNEAEIFRKAMQRHRGEFAAIIMEPVMYNAGCILPDRDFVRLVREEATRDGIVLIFDEVLSGFRMGPGGGQEYVGVTPDITCLSKALGGGMPLSAVAGKHEVMKSLTPEGPTVVSGTYIGHLVPVMGALASLEELRRPGFYDRLNSLSNRLYDGFNEILRRRGIKAVVQGLGARFGIFFGMEETPIMNFRKVTREYDSAQARKFIKKALEHGLHFRDPGNRISPLHYGISIQHGEDVISESLNRLDDIFTDF